MRKRTNKIQNKETKQKRYKQASKKNKNKKNTNSVEYIKQKDIPVVMPIIGENPLLKTPIRCIFRYMVLVSIEHEHFRYMTMVLFTM